ncbi:MAG: hypothetical protein GTO18_16945 [Anaerolineales bacterium]|nr:hypothetical protein [Anaerolineales bacterium]
MRLVNLASLLEAILLFILLSSCGPLQTPQPDPTDIDTSGEISPPVGDLATQEQPLDASSGEPGDLELSPKYSIYVGMIQEGFCGPTTNSGWFSSFDFDSAFLNVQFVPPGASSLFPNGGFYEDSIIPLQSVHGRGDVMSYSICPDYDAVANENSVTSGPNPFEPFLQISLVDELAPVPSVGDTGPHVNLQFNMSTAIGGGTIMEWESAIGIGVLGAPFDTFGVVFSVGWDSIMAGQEFEVNAIYEDEGQIQNWTIRFVPQ